MLSTLQIDGFLCVLRFHPPIKLTATYSWNIVESGIKHHNPNPPPPIDVLST